MTPCRASSGITGVQFWSCRSRTAASGSPNAAAFWYQLIASDLFGCKPTAPSLRRKFGSNVFPTPVAAREFPALAARSYSSRAEPMSCSASIASPRSIKTLTGSAVEGAGARRTTAGELFRTVSRMGPDGGAAGTSGRDGVVRATGAAKVAGSGFSFLKGASGAGTGGDVTVSLRALSETGAELSSGEAELTDCGLSSGRSLSSAPPTSGNCSDKFGAGAGLIPTERAHCSSLSTCR